MTITLSALYRYPLKSAQGQALSHSAVSPQGLPLDRDWMIATPEGLYITARTHPQLIRVQAIPNDDGIFFSAPGMDDIFVPLSAFQRQQQAEIWDDHFAARSGAQAANDWFSSYLEQTVIVMWIGLEPHRRVRRRPEIAISFNDGYPLLLIGEASLHELNRRAGQDFDMRRFRPNLVIANSAAFAEDGWRKIKIGEVIFEIVKPCERCAITTLDPDTALAAARGEPLRTLASFRKAADGVIFGQNIIALNRGQLKPGQPVTILD
ncbi:MOSC domain-containing protein [Chitinibacter sp. S2-10]|uniref:MOSC domain-containing protein n=1 Tax=Chitinibacter sp. S2-10 TaxID=3373597 RepID=UPI0039778A2F